MAFRVGQKVVCINAQDDFGGIVTGLVTGAIYTIARVLPMRRDWPQDGSGLVLSELDNREFRGSRFRPVVERPTDISIFTAMLNPSKQTVDAQ